MSDSTFEALFSWMPIIIILVFYFVALRRAKPTQELLMMDRQKEAVDLLKEIRDLLKNKG